jgi:hypothetical protein
MQAPAIPAAPKARKAERHPRTPPTAVSRGIPTTEEAAIAPVMAPMARRRAAPAKRAPASVSATPSSVATPKEPSTWPPRSPGSHGPPPWRPRRARPGQPDEQQATPAVAVGQRAHRQAQERGAEEGCRGRLAEQRHRRFQVARDDGQERAERDAGERAQEGGDDEGEDGTTVPTLDPFGPAREPSHAPFTLPSRCSSLGRIAAARSGGRCGRFPVEPAASLTVLHPPRSSGTGQPRPCRESPPALPHGAARPALAEFCQQCSGHASQTS